jgi:hypothetical protein
MPSCTIPAHDLGVRAVNDLVIEIARLGATAFAAFLFLLQVVARAIGMRLGRRHADTRKSEAEGVGVVVGGMLGLLAFVLALTLSFANARFQERRAGALEEANAIGTAWLRAEAIGHPRASAIARLLEAYTPVRRDFVAAPLDEAVLTTIHARSAAMQTEMWGHVAALVREQPNPVTASLMAALNDVFDLSAVERQALATGLPPGLFWLLIGMTVATMGALGYQLGLRGLSVHALSLLLIAMWTMVMTAILDLGAPRLGSIRTSTAPYEWTIQGFAGGVPVPPLR